MSPSAHPTPQPCHKPPYGKKRPCCHENGYTEEENKVLEKEFTAGLYQGHDNGYHEGLRHGYDYGYQQGSLYHDHKPIYPAEAEQLSNTTEHYNDDDDDKEEDDTMDCMQRAREEEFTLGLYQGHENGYHEGFTEGHFYGYRQGSYDTGETGIYPAHHEVEANTGKVCALRAIQAPKGIRPKKNSSTWLEQTKLIFPWICARFPCSLRALTTL